MSKETPTEENFEYTIGGKLERSRLKKKWTIEQVSKKICVSEKYLIAIEKGDFKNLPENAFTMGFIRSYADLVGIDADPLVAEFKKCIKSINKTTEQPYNTYDFSQKSSGKKYIYISVFFLIIIMLWIVITSIMNVDESKQTKSTQTEQSQQTSATENKVTEEKSDTSQDNSTTLETTTETTTDDLNSDDLNSEQSKTEQTTNEVVTIEPEEKPTRAKFIAIDDVIISVYKPDGSYYLQDKELKKGRWITTPLNEGYEIQANNGGLVAISIDGLYDYKVMGEKGIVMYSVEINTEELAKRFN